MPTAALRRVLTLTLVAGLLAVGTPLAVPSSAYAESDPRSGPGLSVTPRQLNQAMECSGRLRGVKRNVVLLTPAFSTARESYGAGYRRQLPAIGRTTCTLNLPDRGFRDLQRAAEYNVRAIRRIAARSGRQVVVLGHQHGALNALWAMRFWPDVADRVSDFIALATPFQGTDGARALCANGLRACPPAFWQISTGSRYLRALTKRPLPTGPSYTSIATAFDEVIVPQPKASRLRGARNIQLQDICPGRPVEHFSILFDNLAYRLVVDAITHQGPAKPRRIPRSVCSGSPTMPGVTSLPAIVELGAGALGFLLNFAINIPVQAVSSEPRLRRYAG